MSSVDWLSEEKYNVCKEDFMPKKKKKIKKEVKAIGTKHSSSPKPELRPLKQITPDQD